MSYTKVDPDLGVRVVAVEDVYSTIRDAREVFWYVQDFLLHLGGEVQSLEAPRDEYEAWEAKFTLHNLWVVVIPSHRQGYAIRFEVEDVLKDCVSLFDFMGLFLEVYRERWLDLKSRGSIPLIPF